MSGILTAKASGRQYDAALGHFDAALAIQRPLYGPTAAGGSGFGGADSGGELLVGQTLEEAAAVCGVRGDYGAAVARLREALAIKLRYLDPADLRVARCQVDLARQLKHVAAADVAAAAAGASASGGGGGGGARGDASASEALMEAIELVQAARTACDRAAIREVSGPNSGGSPGRDPLTTSAGALLSELQAAFAALSVTSPRRSLSPRGVGGSGGGGGRSELSAMPRRTAAMPLSPQALFSGPGLTRNGGRSQVEQDIMITVSTQSKPAAQLLIGPKSPGGGGNNSQRLTEWSQAEQKSPALLTPAKQARALFSGPARPGSPGGSTLQSVLAHGDQDIVTRHGQV